ncbi:MAG: hypothetical protein RMZ41_023510 [Nostoc sp. DedVER02]|uniref:hypothetical protein n=1 Tax=unclassified Nostoc TaxID=2593658 RepID=UPI002AD2CA76|nr:MULTISPECIES: hypothetical protein [unclassified Nostoc]MDZ7984548.1 hypothetical protein [Nostoc sp. DedVER02]MDZ8114392.1 hypothetical protein [Nostoc sp. DedVER01b]
MTLEKERITIGVFARCSDALLVLQELKASNFPMHKVSAIAQNVEEQSDIAGVEVKERTSNISASEVAEAHNGEALGDFSGLLVGFVIWLVPDIGKVMLAGLQATAIASTLTDGLPGLFLNLGISKEQAQGYSNLVCKGYCLVIVTGVDIEIRLAQRIFNRRDLQERGINGPYLTPNSRYKYAISVFYTRKDAEKALTELRTAGFPMTQVSIITKNVNGLGDMFELDIKSSQHNYTSLGIPDDAGRYYEHQVSLGYYLIVIKGTDIYIAGARAILESNKSQYFSIYSQSKVDVASAR